MVTYREIGLREPEAIECARLIREHSWGIEYPVDVWSELQHAEYLIGAFEGIKLVGCASITRVASPDNVDNGRLWFGDAVVLPTHRGRGIYRTLYAKRMRHLETTDEPVFSCTDNPLIERFLLKHQWSLYRITKDESGGICKVFQKN